MMSDDRRSIAQSIILTHTTLKDEKSCSIYSYHDIKHGRDHLVNIKPKYDRHYSYGSIDFRQGQNVTNVSREGL